METATEDEADTMLRQRETLLEAQSRQGEKVTDKGPRLEYEQMFRKLVSLGSLYLRSIASALTRNRVSRKSARANPVSRSVRTLSVTRTHPPPHRWPSCR